MAKKIKLAKGTGGSWSALADATKVKSPAKEPGDFKIDNAGYRGSRIKIKLKNPKGYSGTSED